jgi:putative mRNA 3-end processing factor
MQIRGAHLRHGVDQGFVLSDHADWPGLMDTISATGAEDVHVTHGYIVPFVRMLRKRGIDAQPLEAKHAVTFS